MQLLAFSISSSAGPRCVAHHQTANVRAHARAREIVDQRQTLLARRGGARCWAALSVELSLSLDDQWNRPI